MKKKKLFIGVSVFYVACMGLVAFGIYENLKEVNLVKDEAKEVTAEIEEYNDMVTDINYKIDMTDDPAYIESYVRAKYGYVKPNEIVFISEDN
ncbi:MAG: FtsB family cell division protein [Lachnospirales bacterium]